jgi:hypothetical protein
MEYLTSEGVLNFPIFAKHLGIEPFELEYLYCDTLKEFPDADNFWLVDYIEELINSVGYEQLPNIIY